MVSNTRLSYLRIKTQPSPEIFRKLSYGVKTEYCSIMICCYRQEMLSDIHIVHNRSNCSIIIGCEDYDNAMIDADPVLTD